MNRKQAFLDSSGRLREPRDRTGPKRFFVSSVSQNPSLAGDCDGFLTALRMDVNVSNVSSEEVSGVKTSTRPLEGQ
jgi:hypothetical protein